MTATAAPSGQRKSLFRRPQAEHGFWSWFTTIDHKKIGILYFVTAFTFFIVGGIEALIIRLQLAQANLELVSPGLYNQIFTMHGLTMIFFALMPLSASFFNYLLPLMIGARDVAFPRLNAFSYWVFLAAGIFLYSGVFLGGLPDGGWFNYAPLSTTVGPDPLGYTETLAQAHAVRMIFYSVGIQIAGIASLASSVNFIVTILNMRAPGMTLMRMPVFIGTALVTSFLMLFAMPAIGIACWQLLFDIRFGSNFFNPATGGDPVLWQHMFWLFGHPEVYILILPAFGIVSEVLPVFSRKPLFGYTALVFSGIAIGFMGWGVWAHHMFAVGLGPVANSAFALSTMFIAVPTGVKIFNWLGTIWGGKLRFTTPMLFAIGLVAMFTIGGLSGVTHGVVPSNYQQTDTYYVVAHFHYVLFGGALFGLFAGMYYWAPKVTGRRLDERLGKTHFWLNFVGFNVTFGPMHIVGLRGMPRRIDTYDTGFGWEISNVIETVGAFIIALATLVFMINVLYSVFLKKGEEAGNDPWDARTVEWMTSSPPPHYNFAEVPRVTARDELWHRKYTPGSADETIRVPAGGSSDGDEEEHGAHIRMPDPSYYPLVAALGLPIMGWSLLTGGTAMIVMLAVGATITFAGLVGWTLEPGFENGEHA
ncbi:MAG: cytochrome c oxidase subunit I [Egibacteraceae bacterium]